MTAPEGMVVVDAPDIVPPFQLNAAVVVIGCVPVRVPVRVTVPTVTGTSRVTVWPTTAVSPAIGTPAPPQVDALLQLPFCVLVKVTAYSGAAANNKIQTA